MKYLIFLLFVFPLVGLEAQVTANPPDPINQCDVFNTGDEMEAFDLTQSEAQIINGQANVVVTFHETSGDALSGTNAFSNPEAYINIYNPQQVFVRLQSTNGMGWDVTTLEIFVEATTAPQAEPDDLFVDDGDGNGIAVFDLTVNNTVMIGSLNPSDILVEYFTSEEDALTNTNVISNPMAYTNVDNPQTIYVRFSDVTNNCFAITSFRIEADELLGISENIITDLKLIPNPASERVILSSQFLTSESVVTIINLQGREVYSSVVIPHENRIELQVSDLETGIYYLKLALDGTIVTRKFIVK